MKNRIKLVTNPLSAALATFVLASPHASAASQTWSNTGTASANWSEGTNWSGGAAPGATSGNTSTDVATFNTSAGTYGTSANPILIDSGRNISGLTFNGSSSNFTIGTTGGNALHMRSGGSILLGNGLTTNNTTISINAPLLMYGGLTINNQAPNNTNKFVIGGNISSATAGAKTLSINSVSASGTNVNEITGLISNGAGTVSVTQSTTGGLWRLLNDANSFTGNLSVQGGVVAVSSIGDQGVASAAGAGTTINLGASTAGGGLSYLGGAVTTNRTINMAGTTGGATISANNASGVLKFTSDLTVSGVGNKTLSLGGASGQGEFAGVIKDYDASNKTSISSLSTSTSVWTLSGNNTFTGNITVSGGTLVLSGTNVTTGTTTLTGGTLSVSSDANLSGTGSALVFDGGTLRVTGTGLTSLNTGRTTTFNAGKNARFNIADANNNFTVSQNLNQTTGGLTKDGSGTLTVAGTSTYTGNTSISAGTVVFAKQASLYNSDAASWTTSKILVQAGGVLALGVGDSASGYFDATALDTFRDASHMGASSGSVGMRNSAVLGFDTTNATSGTFTYNSNITNFGTSTTNGIAKLGAGTLILGGNNTYTGTTTVSEGTLAVNGSLAGGVTVNLGATLGGNGTIAGATTVSGNLNPGNSPGLLTFSNSLTLGSNATTTMEITGANSSGTRGTTYDAINVGSGLTYGGTLTLNFDTLFTQDGIYTFNLFDAATTSGYFSSMSLAGVYSGSFANTSNSSILSITQGDNSWSFNQGDGVLTFTVVPEPNAAMVVGSLALMALLRRRRD
jgi:autotransporter-associated beta strand protein